MAWNKEIIPFTYSAFPPSHLPTLALGTCSEAQATKPREGGGTGMKNTSCRSQGDPVQGETNQQASAGQCEHQSDSPRGHDYLNPGDYSLS